MIDGDDGDAGDDDGDDDDDGGDGEDDDDGTGPDDWPFLPKGWATTVGSLIGRWLDGAASSEKGRRQTTPAFEL